MKNSLKKYFIPHVENDHKPHFLRGRMILYLAGIVLALETVFLFQSFYVISYTDFFAAILPNVLIDQTNENRQADNLGLLAPNSLLEEAANLKAEDMAEKGYFAHISPENQTPWYWFSEVGYIFNYAGENLAVNFVGLGRTSHGAIFRLLLSLIRRAVAARPTCRTTSGSSVPGP